MECICSLAYANMHRPCRNCLATEVERLKAENIKLAKASAFINPEVTKLREALEVIAIALSNKGDWWPAREYLDKREVYHGDLDNYRVLYAVTQAALKGDSG